MPTNPLRKALAAEPAFDRSDWTLDQHCAHANQQLRDKGINEYRRKIGLFPVRWVVRDGRVVIEG